MALVSFALGLCICLVVYVGSLVLLCCS